MKPVARSAIVCLFGLVVGCGLSERNDFMVGRQCDPRAESPCDENQSCLPHVLIDDQRFDDFRCRDRASFEGDDAPLAYCSDEAGHACPGDLVCNADRIRQDVGRRPFVCKLPNDVFSPPLDGGQ